MISVDRKKLHNHLHGVLTQKREFFITTTVRATNPTEFPLSG
jgi:hypothetical protein